MEPRLGAAPALWECLLRGETMMQEYFAEPTTMCGAMLMSCRHDDTLNVAMVDDVPPREADAALRAIVAHYRRRGATPRVRLSPFSPPDWPDRLAAAGFVETSERRRFWIVPGTVCLPPRCEVTVERVTTPDDADRVSAIQAAGFSLAPELHEWDRQLARQRLAEGAVRFYLGCLDGRAVGTGAIMPLPNGTVGLWGLATLPTARHQGVGLAVLGRMTAEALAMGQGPVFFTTSWSNPIEIVYERIGCVPLFRTRAFARGR